MSRVEDILSRVEGKMSRVEGIFLIGFLLSFGRKISGFFGRVKNIPCEFYNNFHVGTPCCSYKAFESNAKFDRVTRKICLQHRRF